MASPRAESDDDSDSALKGPCVARPMDSPFSLSDSDSDSPFSPSDSSTPPPKKNETSLVDESDEARAYLRTLVTGERLDLSEKPRDFMIPVASFYALLNEAGFASDRERRKTSYDARTSILTIFPMSGHRHAHVVNWLGRVGNDTALTTLVPLGCRRPVFSSGAEIIDFIGEWDGSLKQPDLAVLWKDDLGEFIIHTIVEVGCSQTRKSLLASRDSYLKGLSSVSRFISINVVEDPRYKAPRNIDIDQLGDIDGADFQVDSDEGPIWYKGIQWVGKNTLFWEVWERDAIDGQPEQVFLATFDPNDNESQLPFFEIPTIVAAGIEGITIQPANIQDFRQEFLKPALKAEARLRIGKYVKDEKDRRIAEAGVTKKEDEAANGRREANAQRTEREQRRSGR